MSTGYVSLALEPETVYETVSGLIDTELSLGVNLIPGRLIAVFTGVVPTGVKVDEANAGVLTPIASDVIGFAIPTLGMGASVGGGFVGAMPVGKFALGAGLTAIDLLEGEGGARGVPFCAVRPPGHHAEP